MTDLPGFEFKEWVPYEGPRGGQGWKDTETDDVVYQDEKPGTTDAVSPEGTSEIGSRVNEYEASVRERGHGSNIGEWDGETDPFDMSLEEYEEFEAPYHLVEAPPEISEEMPDSINAFGGWPNSEKTVPFWAWASEEYGVEKVHPDIEDEVESYELDDAERAEYENAARLDRELHRRYNPTYDPETDTIEVYRGTGAEHFQDDLESLVFTGVGERGDSVNIQHRAIESWTANPQLAGQFAEDARGVVLMTRVPVDRVVGSWLTSSLFGGEESEILVAGDPEGDVYTRDNVNIMDGEERYELYNQVGVDVRDSWANSVEGLVRGAGEKSAGTSRLEGFALKGEEGIDLGQYQEAYENAPPATKQAILAAMIHVDDDTPLLYALLGQGTPPLKMAKDKADYQDEPRGDQACGNCEFYYEGADGDAICAKVRGEVEPGAWCRLWDSGGEDA